MVINGKYFNSIGKVTDSRTAQKPNIATSGDFPGVLNDRLKAGAEVKFSKHAEARLQTRNINLSTEQKEKLTNAVNKADSKGVRDSLVLMDNLAFVVNVKSRTVITAVNSNELKENVFTNIDGAVFG